MVLRLGSRHVYGTRSMNGFRDGQMYGSRSEVGLVHCYLNGTRYERRRGHRDMLMMINLKLRVSMYSTCMNDCLVLGNDAASWGYLVLSKMAAPIVSRIRDLGVGACCWNGEP